MKTKYLILATLTSVSAVSRVYAQIDITAPGDTIVAYTASGDAGSSPGGEQVSLVIDNNQGTKYLNFDGGSGEDTGFIVTPTMGSAVGGTIVTGARFSTANDGPERDPLTFTLEGSNTGIGGPFTLIFTGDTNLAALAGSRDTFGAPVAFGNGSAFTTYRVMFTSLRTEPNGCCMQVSEAELFGRVVPEPSTMLLGLATLGLTLSRRRR